MPYPDTPTPTEQPASKGLFSGWALRLAVEGTASEPGFTALPCQCQWAPLGWRQRGPAAADLLLVLPWQDVRFAS
jgi:hypothetical protein